MCQGCRQGIRVLKAGHFLCLYWSRTLFAHGKILLLPPLFYLLKSRKIRNVTQEFSLIHKYICKIPVILHKASELSEGRNNQQHWLHSIYNNIETIYMHNQTLPVCWIILSTLQFTTSSVLSFFNSGHTVHGFFFPKVLIYYTKLYTMNILQTSCCSCCSPSPNPTLHFPLQFLSPGQEHRMAPLEQKKPNPQNLRRCCSYSTRSVPMLTTNLPSLCSGSSGSRSSPLTLQNQELNDCLHNTKFLKHRALLIEITGAEGITSCNKASKHCF